MKYQKLLTATTLILILLTVFLIYKYVELSDERDKSNQITDYTVWSEFVDLNASLHNISLELKQYDESMSGQEKELYLSSIGKESNRLNDIGMRLSRIFNSRNQDQYIIYEEHIWIIEEFIEDISHERLADEDKIHSVANVIYDQQQQLRDLFFSEKAIGVPGANQDGNIKKIIDILQVIIEEIEKG